MTEEQKDTGHKQFPCKDCGAKLKFQAGAVSLQCPYCGVQTAIPQSEEEVEELDYLVALDNLLEHGDTIEQAIVKCKACAAESTLGANVTASSCPFCGSSLVTPEGSKKLLKPKSLLPFHVTRDQARTSFKEWVSSLWFAPNALKKYARLDQKLNGVYVPYWTYDCDATSYYQGQRGEDYWTTQTYTTTENGKSVTKTRQVKKTRWYPARGTVWNDFDDLLVLASKSLPRKLTLALEPWDLQNLVPYSDEYLSGFQSESYQIDLRHGFELAKEMTQEAIRESVCLDIGGDHQRIHSLRSQFDRISFKHLLLPIWISAYQYENKPFRFIVNARTGEVQGERPWSWIKIAAASLAGLAVIGVGIFLFMNQ